ncbi:MAG TPA: hypothetical protein VNF68_14775 [Candidatus Baltobacteraceae bacterium]|nr:hypothetical protein [Candidatus Baltobacteraceae bacterium]
MLRAALLAGIVGNIVISIYLSIALPVFFKTPPILLFQWDDSNIVGPSAFAGGWGSAALGFFFDFIVAIVWGACFVFIYRAVPWVRKSTAVSGLLFGVAVMLVMFTVVVPLGHAQPSRDLPSLLDAFVAHTVFFGLPVALVVRRSMAS